MNRGFENSLAGGIVAARSRISTAHQPQVSRMSAAHSVTQLLEQWNNGDRTALDQLIPLIYDELRKMARRYMGLRRDIPATK